MKLDRNFKDKIFNRMKQLTCVDKQKNYWKFYLMYS